MKNKRQMLWSALLKGYGVLFLVFLYLPLGLIVAFSFNANPINVAEWTGFTLDWYATIFQGASVEGNFDAAFTESPERIFDVIRTSFVVALSAASAATVIGTATALALARHKFFGKRFYQALLLLPMLVPDIVLGIALLIFFVGVGIELGLMTRNTPRGSGGVKPPGSATSAALSPPRPSPRSRNTPRSPAP